MAKEHDRFFKEHGKFIATASLENTFDYWVPSKQWEWIFIGNRVQKYRIHIINRRQNVTYNVRGYTSPLKFICESEMKIFQSYKIHEGAKTRKGGHISSRFHLGISLCF